MYISHLAMMYVTTLAVMLCVNMTKALETELEEQRPKPSLFTKILENLPAHIQQNVNMCIQGIKVACAYIFSEKGMELQTVMDQIFHNLPGSLKEVNNVPAKEKILPYGLGYFCWSEGKVYGLKTIEKVGTVLVHVGEITTAVVWFHFTKLQFLYDKCGYENGLITKSGKCFVNADGNLLKVKFSVKDIDSLIKMLFGVWNNHCVFTMVDFEVVSLLSFKLKVVNPNGTKSSFSDSLAEKIVNNMSGYIKTLLTRKARVTMYKALRSTGSYICKDNTLDSEVKRRYKSYLNKPRSKSPDQFQKLCGNNMDYLDIGGDETAPERQ